MGPELELTYAKVPNKVRARSTLVHCATNLNNLPVASIFGKIRK